MITSNGVTPPQIHMGEQIPYTRKPILGRKRSNAILVVINNLLRGMITRRGVPVGRILLGANGGMLFELDSSSGTTSAFSGGYQGDYDSTLEYSEGDIVRITTGSNSGIWGVPPGKNAPAGLAPIFPEPAGATWHFICPWIREFHWLDKTTCSEYKAFIAMTEPVAV